MTKAQSSRSEVPSWIYTRPALGRTGRSVTENNFAKERRSRVSILMREILAEQSRCAPRRRSSEREAPESRGSPRAQTASCSKSCFRTIT
jgi:hypothetical protein